MEKRLQAAESTIAEEREMRKKAKEQVSAYRRELEHAVRSIEAMSQVRVREQRAERVHVENTQSARGTPSPRTPSASSIKVQPGMSWMSPRASSDDNPSEMFEAELASWRDAPLAPEA
jgi:hypothetical protein